MIVTRLIGGLGNQLFQYAVGRHLAEINNSTLKLDISEFPAYGLREYYLSPFNIQESFASAEEIKDLKFRKYGFAEGLMRRIMRKPPEKAPSFIQEKEDFVFDPDILKLSDGIYFEGYWQNEKYFTGIESIIRREFTVKTPPNGTNRELLEQIASCESVSLHVRRGDYVSNPHTNQVHGTCDLDYYQRCIEYMANKVKKAHFFVFSDEPEWARDNLQLTFPITFIDYNGPDSSHEDLRLMSRCKNHIIANSSFSWWGAWLSQNPDKIVLAPERWISDSRFNAADLLPGKWKRV